MRSEAAVVAVLNNIMTHIALAEKFVSDDDFAAFQGDIRSLYAVTRCLEIISEASRRLPAELKARHPSVPWKNIAGAGNVYPHSYEDVSASQIWETVQHALPSPRIVIEAELAASGTL